MANSMTAPQGGMVGRYYVGEGVGGGLARIGQALMANRIGGKADEAEAEYQAGQRAARAKSMDDLVSTVSTPVTDVRETADGVGPMPMRKPSNQEIGAALLKYQNDTGSEIPKDIIGLMAPESGIGGGANRFQFGPAAITQVDGAPAFAVPTYDPSSSSVKVQIAPIGGPVVNRSTGLSADEQADLEVKTEGEKTRIKTAAELAFAQQQAEAAAAKAAAEATAKADAQRRQDQTDKAVTAGNAVELLDRYIAAVGRQPRTAAGRGIETVLGVVGAGNEVEQNAMADAENIGASIVTYAQKQPGPSSDKDVQNYMTQVGILGNKLATREQRLSAARSAKESYLRVVQKYGTNWKPSKQSQPSKTANPFD